MAPPDLRQQLILTELMKSGRVLVKDLAEHLRVSRETIRRDLKLLEGAGHLRCTYGGGVRPAPVGDQPLAERMRVNAREKAKIAALAAPLVGDDRKIFLDTGTTTLALARHIIGNENLGVFTNSIDIAQLLLDGPSLEVTVIGGVLRPGYRALMGYDALESIERHVFDSAYIGIGTVDNVHGFMDFGPEEAAIRRLLVKRSKRVVMLADSAKFGRTASIRTLEPDQVDILVTDAPPRGDFAARMEEAGVEIIHGANDD